MINTSIKFIISNIFDQSKASEKSEAFSLLILNRGNSNIFKFQIPTFHRPFFYSTIETVKIKNYLKSGTGKFLN
ncbi:hypothetical protein AB674_21285 [Flavobacterium sp. ABG]|nr:hypothetical protein AB674_21285 [Flavobacterium sp. ABG]